MQAPERVSDDGQVCFTEQKDSGAKQPTPLPWAPLLVVYLIQLSEPVTATVIFPFITQFVRETGVTGGDERKIGYFAGVIVRTASGTL